MKLYLHTPYYKNSNFMAHLCEHLVLHPRNMNIDEYMLRYYDSGGSLHGEYTSLSFRGNQLLQDHLETIHNPLITHKVINYEMDIFAEEFGERGYFLRLIDKLRNQVYGKSYSSQPKKYLLSEVVAYHDQYYRKGYWVAWDVDSSCIIDHNVSDIKSITQLTLPTYTYQEVLLEWLRNHVWVAPHTRITDVIVTDIIEDIFTTRDTYQKRYCLWSYYTQWASSTFDDSYVLLKFSAHTRYNITKEYIDSYRDRIKSLIVTDNFRSSKKAIGLVCKQEQLTSEMIVELSQMITYEYLQSILAQMNK